MKKSITSYRKAWEKWVKKVGPNCDAYKSKEAKKRRIRHA